MDYGLCGPWTFYDLKICQKPFAKQIKINEMKNRTTLSLNVKNVAQKPIKKSIFVNPKS